MDALLDADTVSKLLKISKRNFESLVARGDGPQFITIGRLRRWRPSDLEAWIQTRLMPPVNPLFDTHHFATDRTDPKEMGDCDN